jgi:AraC-like DNA-binding protein/quercetin dioxygenase-like cupin family protein
VNATPTRVKLLPLPGSNPAEALLATEPDARFALHAHAEWSVGAILAGACEFACEGRAYRAVAGDVVVMAPHALHTAGASADRFEMVMTYLPARWVVATVAMLARPVASPWCATWNAPGLASRLAAGVSTGRGELAELLAQILTLAAQRAPGQGTRQPADPRVEALRQLLQNDAPEPLDLPGLARGMGLSREHVHRLFRQAVGMAPGHYARLARIARAKAMLRDGHLPADVAVACGFADQAHFSRWFRRCFGVAPSRYRSAMVG